MAPIIYAVAAVKTWHLGHENEFDRLTYGTVTKELLNGAEGYVIQSRAGDKINVGADCIDALITALIQARNSKE